MSNIHLDFENSNSVSAGIYRQNSFYVRMDSFFDLDESDQEATSVALAMHAHEYVYFLHNASTAAGQAYLVSNLVLLRALVPGTNDQGHFLGRENMTEEQRQHLVLAGKLMTAQLGATGATSLSHCRDIRTWEFAAPELTQSDSIPAVNVVFSARTEDGELLNQKVTLGLSFITEGVAYDVDREMRRLGGTSREQLDLGVKNFPYLVFSRLIESWSGRRLTAQERIGIGVCALAHRFSGYALAQICAELKKSELPVFDVLKKAREIYSGESEIVLKEIRKQREDLSRGDVIWTAMGEYMKLAEAGAKLRLKRWAPEFTFLTVESRLIINAFNE